MISTTRPKPPSADNRWKLVDATMRRHGYKSYALIESLHTVQECFGFLDKESLQFVAASLHVPFSRAFGVATFYHFFTMKPPGDHTCVICLGTACYIRGATQMVEALEKQFGIKTGQTTADRKVSLLSARCLGSCGLAPAAVFDGVVAGKLTPAVALDKMKEWTS
jgi:bidirectional [NiFe] hydrogenase diaphorase subunit